MAFHTPVTVHDELVVASGQWRDAYGRAPAMAIPSNVPTSTVYLTHMTARACSLLTWCVLASAAVAQEDTVAIAPWLDREFRYWQGDPMMHGPNGECIAGYTDEERRMCFFRDHRYQEIIFEDRLFAGLKIWQPGDCDPLQGDTVAVLTGTWSWANDTLRVNVERTAQYPREDLLRQYLKRGMDKPFEMPMRPTRVCNTERERRFWFEGDRLAEAMRTWD